MSFSTTTNVVAQAEALARSVIQLNKNDVIPIKPLPDSFMTYRPNSLMESYHHGRGVARILARWQADPALQAAGWLHSFIWKKVLTVERVAAACDERTAFLVGEYCCILQQPLAEQVRGKAEVLRRVKLFVAAHYDPALAFLGVANLWDHFLAAQQSETTTRPNFVNEAQLILIPLLDILGMWELKQQVEKWVVEQGPGQQHYQYLLKRIAQTDEIRQQVFAEVERQLLACLSDAQIAPKPVIPRSIYNPQSWQNESVEAYQQKLKVDVLVDHDEACYIALGQIHRLWSPSEGGTIVDYIGNSKLNGYRCLQTVVIVPLGSSHVQVHFHIRTWEMEEINRWGVAAMALRKQDPASLTKVWWPQWQDAYANLESAPIGSRPKHLYVFSPQGQVFHFHRGCTVVDYAYQVHSNVAHQCKRFRVNGEVVGINTPLRHLDLVELERDPQFSGPTEAWLNAAHTDRARHQIKRFLKQRKQSPQNGRAVFDRQLRTFEEYYRINIPEHLLEQALNQAARYHRYERMEDMLVDIAVGRLTSDQILHPLFAKEITRQVQLSPTLRLRPNQLHLARCCRPRPGDDIIGRLRERKGLPFSLKIHRDDCSQVASLPQKIPLTWRLQPHLQQVARLEVTALDENGLVGDMLPLIYAKTPDITLHRLDCVARNGVAHLNFTIEAKSQALIKQIVQEFKQIPHHTINQVRQMELPFLEREDLGRPVTSTIFNPYRRLPVREREMFFGRTQELEQTYDLLKSGTGVIFVQGQKRVGKTSLLLHLKEHYLDRASIEPIFIDLQLISHITGPAFFYEIANAIYNELRRDARINDIGPPLWDHSEAGSPIQFIDYLHNIRSNFDSSKLVLLIDEFSRTIDAYQQNPQDDNLFQQWRGILHATVPQVSYVMVIQQQTYDTLHHQPNQPQLDPIWHLLELGEPILLKPLDEQAARQLIERPTHNYLEYSSEAIHLIWRLTGGSPFLIQAICFNVVRHMARVQRGQVDLADIEALQIEFMQPNENLFAHLLDLIKGVAHPICQYIAHLSATNDQVVPLHILQTAFPDVSPTKLQRTLHKLVDQDIILEPEANAWQFASLLFARWLAQNSAVDPTPTPNGLSTS